jgi:hypothetical protein
MSRTPSSIAIERRGHIEKILMAVQIHGVPAIFQDVHRAKIREFFRRDRPAYKEISAELLLKGVPQEDIEDLVRGDDAAADDELSAGGIGAVSAIDGITNEHAGPSDRIKSITYRHPRDERPSWRDHAINACDLCDQRFPDIKYVVPGLFPEGVTLLVSRPKVGKSWLLLQVGSATANGVATLAAEVNSICGDVLSLSLEDGKRRVQRRMTKYFGVSKQNWPSRMTIVPAWRRLDEGGLEDLREWCESVDKPTLISIDTLKKVRPPKKGGQTDYDADYAACEGLLKLAHEYPGLAIFAACHDRKMGADDVFDTVSGTLGLTGGVDTIAIIKRDPQGTTLHIRGRDLVDDIEKAVRFDRETCRWVILGEAAEVRRSEGRTTILEALQSAPTEGMTVSEIMIATGVGSRGAVDMALGRMAKDGEIERRGRGRYGLPSVRALEALESEKLPQAVDPPIISPPSNASNASNPALDFPELPASLDRRGATCPADR